MVYTNSKNGYFHIFQRGGSTTNQIIKMISELEGWGWWYIIDILDFRSGQPNNIDNPDQQSGFADDFEFGHPWIESLFFGRGRVFFWTSKMKWWSSLVRICDWLVVWNMNFMTFHSVGNFMYFIIPTDEVIFFRGVATPPTRWELGFDRGTFGVN